MKLFQTMPCRVKSYESALDGLNLTDKLLIAFNDVCNSGQGILMPAGYTDNVGSFIYIPLISKIFDLNINTSTFLFFTCYGILCILISLFGLFKLYNSKLSKIYGTSLIILLGLLFIIISDTYCFYGLTTLALITWWSKLFELKYEKYKNFILLFLITGFLIGFSHTVRGHSGTGILISIIILLIINVYFNREYKKLLSIFIIFIPILLINFQINKLKIESKNYLLENTEISSLKIDLNFHRAVWHNAYYNLGYLDDHSDKEVPLSTDGYSVKKAMEINPDIVLFSMEYEQLLKNEYLNFVKKYPLFFIKIIVSKLGVILMYIILFLNIGIYFLFKYKLSKFSAIFFGIGITFNSLFGILAEPDYTYLLGMFAFSSIYTIKILEDKYNYKV